MHVIESIIISPGDASVTEVSAAGAVSIPIGVARHFDALGQALEAHLGAPCTFAEGPVSEWGPETILICRPDVLYVLVQNGCSAFSRLVCVDLNRTNILDRVEAFGLAAAIDVLDYASWMSDSRLPGALFGRKELVSQIRAEPDAGLLKSGKRYTRMTRADTNLPTLLADYLAEYFRAGLGAN